ncbi:MAG: hypothetical protein NTY38_00470, partial [Acidobacteria bacterium]|nr:hypothetical protein [Acidobacteriota bacterium]
MRSLLQTIRRLSWLLWMAAPSLFAHCCSSPGDCEETSGYNLANAIVQGILGVASAGIGTALVNVAGTVGGLWPNPPVDPPPETPPGTPPPGPPDVEWTGPDGVTRVLTWSPENNAYVNILTGGLVAPDNIEGWKQNIGQNKQQVDDWRTRNQQLEKAGLDAQHQALAAIQADAAARAKILANLSRMEKQVIFGNGANDLLRPPGEPGNILDNISKLAGDVASGKDIDRQKLAAITRYYGDTVSGKLLPPDKMPQPGDSEKGVWVEGIKSTFKEVSTCTNENGLSWKGLAARTGLAIVTGGFSEVPISVGAMEEYVDKGGNSVLGGFVAGAEAVVVGEIAGAAMGVIGKGAIVGGRVAGELVGEAGEAIVKAAAGGSTVARTLVKGAAVVGDVAGSVSTNIVKPIASVMKEVKTLLTTEIGAPAASAEGAAARALGTGAKAESAAATAGKAE